MRDTLSSMLSCFLKIVQQTHMTTSNLEIQSEIETLKPMHMQKWWNFIY